ncbi:unnamed protein product [Prorocentrum cordatum]|uniref:Aminotransferase class I/classII large domain-containing protein n=1 Tax=Prorocentrum cordatum TaxID=2364126 RepID=A0ABN9SQS0_9DINO|nr:unnamed protein product [Polarella glacialis]
MAEPVAKKAKVAEAQDFIKGWPSPDLLTQPELKDALTSSFKSFIGNTQMFLNYGDAQNGAYMLGTPVFRKTLAEFLSKQYGKTVDWNCIMSTGGSSMGTDISIRIHSAAGDYAVSEAPTYYLAHEMMRNRGLNLLEVPLQPDGMDLDALEKVLNGEHKGKIKLVYTVCVHHNPTGITMCNAKRERLVKMAKQYDFKIIADEAYQLLNFAPSSALDVLPRRPRQPPRPRDRHLLEAHRARRQGRLGAGAPTDSEAADQHWFHRLRQQSCHHVVWSAQRVHRLWRPLAKHIETVSKKLGAKKDLLVSELKKIGLEPNDPKGGYFVWVKSKGKMTGRSGKGMSLNPPDAYADYMRLCFAWLSEEQIREGVEFLKQ